MGLAATASVMLIEARMTCERQRPLGSPVRQVGEPRPEQRRSDKGNYEE